MKTAIKFLLLAAMGLTGGIALSLLTIGDGQGTTEIVRGVFTVRTADAAAQPRLSPGGAEAAARQAAGTRMGETIADLATLNGRPVGKQYLSLAASGFAPAAVEISSSASNFRFTTNPPADLWVFIYKRSGVAMPDWGIGNGVVEVQVVINDATGAVESAGVLRYNPAAQ